jgi:hypothetical protein
LSSKLNVGDGRLDASGFVRQLLLGPFTFKPSIADGLAKQDIGPLALKDIASDFHDTIDAPRAVLFALSHLPLRCHVSAYWSCRIAGVGTCRSWRPPNHSDIESMATMAMAGPWLERLSAKE